MTFVFVKSTKKGMQEYGTVYARTRGKAGSSRHSLGFAIKETEWFKYRLLQYNNSQIITSLGIKYSQFANILAQIKTALEDDIDPKMTSAIIHSIKSTCINGDDMEITDVKKKGVKLDDHIKKIADDYESGARMKVGTATKVSTGYVKSLRSIGSKIKKYEIERRKHLTLDDVTMEFQRDFIKWCTDRGNHVNTIHSDMGLLHTLMAIAYEQRLTKCEDFRNSEFVPRGEDVDQVYLTSEQIQQMLNFDLSSKEIIIDHIKKAGYKEYKEKHLISKLTKIWSKQIENTRDVFIVGCLTGQRISDYSRVNKEMLRQLDNYTFINLTQKKTGKEVYIPLDKSVKMLIEKHDGGMPHVPESTFNKNLKFIGELLGWTHRAQIDESRMGFKTGTRFCDMLGSHTARRTFATIAYAAGVPIASIMAVTGHSSEKSFRRYLKLQVEDKAIIAARDLADVIKTK